MGYGMIGHTSEVLTITKWMMMIFDLSLSFITFV